MGWSEVEIIDHDLGSSASLGAAARHGFDQLVGAVALGQVGIVMSREVSRLSRTDKDWCHLMEVCRVFDTLVSDADQIYDLSLTDDQMVLGIKGTMSLVELNVLRQRLQAGREAKAARGELVHLLPPGYIWDASNQVVKDPDERVRRAIETLPPMQRAVVVLRLVEELDYADIAATLGCSVQAVRANLHLGRQRVRRLAGEAP